MMEKTNKKSLWLTPMALLLGGLLLFAAGCAGEKTDVSGVTMEAIVEANDFQTVLKSHRSVSLEFSAPDSDNVEKVYADGKRTYTELENASALVTEDETWQLDAVDGEEIYSLYWYAMEAEEESEQRETPSDFTILVPDLTVTEIIESVRGNGDGTLTVTTSLSREGTKELMERQWIELPEDSAAPEQKAEYVIDGSTLELLSAHYCVKGGGEVLNDYTIRVSYDAGEPEGLAALEAKIAELKSGAEANRRTVRVFYDYGTDREQTYEIAASKQYKVFAYLKEGYDYIYSDPEKKEPFTGSSEMTDVTMYAFSEE